MRSTNEILIDVKDNVDVDKEELKMALLVLDAINFFNHRYIRRLFENNYASKLIMNREFPDEAHKQLGVSKSEYLAMKQDPYVYLGPSHTPGTEEYNYIYKIANNVLDHVIKEYNKKAEV